MRAPIGWGGLHSKAHVAAALLRIPPAHRSTTKYRYHHRSGTHAPGALLQTAVHYAARVGRAQLRIGGAQRAQQRGGRSLRALQPSGHQPLALRALQLQVCYPASRRAAGRASRPSQADLLSRAPTSAATPQQPLSHGSACVCGGVCVGRWGSGSGSQLLAVSQWRRRPRVVLVVKQRAHSCAASRLAVRSSLRNSFLVSNSRRSSAVSLHCSSPPAGGGWGARGRVGMCVVGVNLSFSRAQVTTRTTHGRGRPRAEGGGGGGGAHPTCHRRP